MEFKELKGYEGLYEISEFGDIYGLEKAVISGKNGKCIRNYPRKEKAQRLDKYGYKRTTVCKDGICKAISIHRLVATTFIEGDSKLTVNHKDGNKLNNHFSNLEWLSSLENLKHARENGLVGKSNPNIGVENKLSKLNEDQVREIRLSDLSLRKLQKIYGVHHSVIHGIKKGNRYFNVK